MTSKSKKDKIKQGNLRDFDLLYDTLLSGGTYSDYRSELLDRSMPQEMPLEITEDDILAAWILGKDEESELYARGGHLHQDIGSQIKMAKTGVNLYLNGAFDEDKNKGLYSSDSGHNYTAGIPYVQQFDSLGGLGFNVAANANGASSDPYAKFIMGDTSGGFLQLMMSQKQSLKEGADYIKGMEQNFAIGDTASRLQQYNTMQPIARSNMNADEIDRWTWFWDPAGIMHDWGIIDYDVSEGQDFLNSIAESTEKRNTQNWITSNRNSELIQTYNQKSLPYMAACGGKMKNKLASGGYINSHYDYITDPLVKVDAGGTHQENPNEGVLTSIAPDGQPNLVEEGETIINNGQEDAYVFSDRIVADEEILKSHLLPVKFAGKTYADISKELDKIIEEHKNDEISKRTFDEMISRLQQALEDQKYQEKAEEVAKFIDGLSDEEKEQLELTMVEEAQAEQQAAEEQAIAELQAQELAALEQQVQPEQAPEQVVTEQPEELIVPSRYDQMMSRALFADAANLGMFQSGGFEKAAADAYFYTTHPKTAFNRAKKEYNKQDLQFKNTSYGLIVSSPIPSIIDAYENVKDRIDDYKALKSIERLVDYETDRLYERLPKKHVSDYIFDLINNLTGYPTISDNKKSKGGHLHQYDPWIYSQIDEDYPSLKKTGLKSNYVTFVPEETNYGYTGEKRVADVNLPDEEMLDYNLIGAIDPNTTTIVETEIPIEPKDKPTHNEQDFDYSTYLRYAPAIGSGIQYLSDLFGVTNRNNYTNPNLFQRSINTIPNVGFTPLGGYRTFNPFDETFQLNALRSMNEAARRTVINNSNGNYGATLAALNALNYNTSGQFGDLALKAREYNEKERQAIDEYNLKINQINASLSMTAQEKNQAIAAQKARLTATLAEMRQQIEDTNDAARSANMTNFYQNLGNVGKENFNMTMVRSNPAFYYTVTDDGHIIYKNGFDGLNERDQAFVRSVAEPQAEELRKKHLEEANKKANETTNPDRTNWSPMMYSYFGRPSLFGHRSLTNNGRN